MEPLIDMASASVTLDVSGMSCAACQTHIEKSLRRAPGVRAASVDLLSHRARVEFDPAATTPDSLIAVVEDSGYGAALLSPGPAAPGSAAEAGPSSGAASDLENRALRRKAIVALAVGALTMALSMSGMRNPGSAPGLPLRWLLLALTLPVMAWAGGSIYRSAWRAARHGATNMNTLVALGTGAAFLYSLATTVRPGWFLRHGLEPAVYYEAVSFILGFLLLGQWLEARAKHRTLDAVRGIAALQPPQALVLRDGEEVPVPLEQLRRGDRVVVRPGERVPVDGVVISGRSSADESLLTGESRPIPKQAGDTVIGGSLNYDGSLVLSATALGRDSRLAQMVRLIEQAQMGKAPLQRVADRVSAVFVPAVLAMAVATFVGWFAMGGEARSWAIANAVAVLVIACPCAMGLAVPAALTVAVGRAAQLGILLKGGEAVERLASVDTVLFDKTGTLTAGRPSLVAIHACEGVPATAVLEAAASAEARSEHPLAAAVVAAARAQGIEFAPAEQLQTLPGQGVEATAAGNRILAGSAALLAGRGVEVKGAEQLPAGATTVWVARNGSLLGALAFADALRPTAAEAVARLLGMSLQVGLLSGDRVETAKAIAAQAGIGRVYAEKLPEQKLAVIRELGEQGRRVAMVGDGINDAAALAQADAGIAMGTGTDLAQEAGDAILLSADPAAVPATIALCRVARRVMKQNLAWAAVYNVVGIPLAAGLLYPWLHRLLNPGIASAAMALSSISVLANSLRLARWRP